MKRKMSTDGQREYYRLSTSEVIDRLNSSESGLAAAEAAERLEQLGANSLQVDRRQSWIFTFFRQFKDLMILLLIASAALSFYLHDARTAIVLLVLVLFNTIMGFLQEFKAEKLMQSLEKLVAHNAHVLRDNKLLEVPASELVPGDIVTIEAGDSVPADMRLLSEEELVTNDFALTGESNPTRKFLHAISDKVTLARRHNLVFMGTTVASGNGTGIVIATGMHSTLGRIASLSQGIATEPSPLQKEMNHIARLVTYGTIILSIILLPIAIHSGLAAKAAILFAVAFAVSIIPQGLPAEINTSLAQAANKLAKIKALVKKLSAVETLGATSVILTDKTGTLTKNQMTVTQFLIGKTAYKVTGTGYEPKGTIENSHGKTLGENELKELELFLIASSFASNAQISPPDDEHTDWYCLGDPTEGATVTLAVKAGINVAELDKNYPELRELQFDSARKRMSSIRQWGQSGKQLYLFTKGAPENVLARCTHIWDHGHTRKLTAADKKFILAANEQLAGEAMRNLAVAYKTLPGTTKPRELDIDKTERQLTWLGLSSMVDPLREEVPAAMLAARQAHVKVSIVTGDYAVTARAIAIKAKLAETPADITVVSGDELDDLSDKKVVALVKRGGIIFSRVAPEDKLRIVNLVRDSGAVVAVTGDGINDAPALKRANIGVAMGKSGTDVAKQSAEIVLLDDSFHTLVAAIQQGRTIFQNIKKSTLSCFTSNAAELIVNLVSLAVATLLNVPLALSVMEILAIDLVAELFPIAALGWDKADGKLMREKPRDPKSHILNPISIADLLWCGVLIGGFAFLNYLWFYGRHQIDPQNLADDSLIHWQATALTYLTIVLCQLANILQRRSVNGLFTKYQLHNKQLWLAIALSLFCVVNIIYNPWVAPYFHAGSLGLIDWLTALMAAALFVLIREFERHTRKRGHKALFANHHPAKIKKHLTLIRQTTR